MSFKCVSVTRQGALPAISLCPAPLPALLPGTRFAHKQLYQVLWANPIVFAYHHAW